MSIQTPLQAPMWMVMPNKLTQKTTHKQYIFNHNVHISPVKKSLPRRHILATVNCQDIYILKRHTSYIQFNFSYLVARSDPEVQAGLGVPVSHRQGVRAGHELQVYLIHRVHLDRIRWK